MHTNFALDGDVLDELVENPIRQKCSGSLKYQSGSGPRYYYSYRQCCGFGRIRPGTEINVRIRKKICKKEPYFQAEIGQFNY